MDSQEERIYVAVIVIAGTLAIVFVSLFLMMRRQYKRNLRLEREARRLEMEVQERERKRMANDLHDELSPMLTGIKMGLDNVVPAGEEDTNRMQKAYRLIDSMSRRMREISFNLMPAALLRKGLFNALEELSSYINRNNERLTFMLQAPVTGSDKIPENVSVNTYRIVQEIVHNTLKHSGASELKMELEIEDDTLYLSSIDNGVGFNLGATSDGAPGLGIKSIEGRVDLLGGEMNLQSKINKGTSYNIEIPLTKK